MPYTTIEKIIARHCGKPVQPGDYVYTQVDFIMLHDGSAAFTANIFKDMGGSKVFDNKKLGLFFDHSAPSPRPEVANMQKLAREFAKQQGCFMFDIGQGIGHHLMLEQGFAQPGALIIGADSHCCTYGAAGAFGMGLGPTDIAAAMISGQTWVKVPTSIRVNFYGSLNYPACAKDAILWLIGLLGSSGASYQAIEFYDKDNSLSFEEKITIANMAIEMEAKAGIFAQAESIADAGANYSAVYDINLANIKPLLAMPHQVENIHPVSAGAGTKIDMILFGSCTNGRYKDLQIAAQIIGAKKIHKDVRFMIAPGSQQVLLQAIAGGELNTLIKAGAIVLVPGCGPCLGAVGGIPADGDVVLSTANRNFLGRMANTQASIYLCSPATAAYSALCGFISEPQ